MILPALKPASHRAVADELRRLLPQLEGRMAERAVLPFGVPLLDRHLPMGGLSVGAVHEILPAMPGDLPAAFGFTIAMVSRLPQDGPIVVIAGRSLRALGRPCYQGVAGLGLDPERILLVEVKDDTQALWAIETAVRSAAPAAVIGLTGTELRFQDSQRLHLAAKTAQVPLVLLYAREAQRASAATTRWCVRAAAAARDRFGLLTQWRWRIVLERCRNGRPGEWLVEWDHVAFRFSLVAALADPALCHGASSHAIGGGAG